MVYVIVNSLTVNDIIQPVVNYKSVYTHIQQTSDFLKHASRSKLITTELLFLLDFYDFHFESKVGSYKVDLKDLQDLQI